MRSEQGGFSVTIAPMKWRADGRQTPRARQAIAARPLFSAAAPRYRPQMPSLPAPRRVRLGALALLTCAALCSCQREAEAPGEAPAKAPAKALDQPVSPPIPCAIVSGPEDAQTLSQLEIKDGRVIRVVTRAERREGQLTWEHKLSYEGGRLTSVDKAVASAQVSVGMRALTTFSYGEDGRLLESSYRDMAGRIHRQRWTYEDDATRPSTAEVLLGDRVVERIRYAYDGSPNWTGALFLPGPRFGASEVYATGVGPDASEALSQTMRFDPQTGALIELIHGGGEREHYLYGDACPNSR